MGSEVVICRHPCVEALGHVLCRVCREQNELWGEAMARLIDDGPDEREPTAPGELGHVRAAEAG